MSQQREKTQTELDLALCRKAFKAAQRCDRAGNRRTALLLRKLADALQESSTKLDRCLQENASLELMAKALDRATDRALKKDRHTAWCAKTANPDHACTSPAECFFLNNPRPSAVKTT